MVETNVPVENRLNKQIENALGAGKVKQATNLCADFLEQVYGLSAVRLWALRDFAEHQVAEETSLRSRFDNNLVWLFKVREEKIPGYHPKLKYESPYFKDEQIEELDGIYEDYQRRIVGGKPAKAKFLKLIKQAVEDLPLA